MSVVGSIAEGNYITHKIIKMLFFRLILENLTITILLKLRIEHLILDDLNIDSFDLNLQIELLKTSQSSFC